MMLILMARILVWFGFDFVHSSGPLIVCGWAERGTHCRVVDGSDEAADRDEALVVCVEELGQVIDCVLVQALQIVDRVLESTDVDHFCSLLVKRLDCLLKLCVVHLELFCLHFDITKTLLCDRLVKLALEGCVHERNKVVLADLLGSQLVPEVLFEMGNIFIWHLNIVFTQGKPELLSTEPVVLVLIVLLEHHRYVRIVTLSLRC